MTDRYNALVVTLEKNMRDDDCEALIAAINQLRHVADVKGNVADMDSHIARSQALYELRGKLWDVLKD